MKIFLERGYLKANKFIYGLDKDFGNFFVLLDEERVVHGVYSPIKTGKAFLRFKNIHFNHLHNLLIQLKLLIYSLIYS